MTQAIPLSKRIDYYDEWEEKTRDNREKAQKDRDYYDHKQWSSEDLATLKVRKQPPSVKNYIARKINFIIGEEISGRVDPVALPKTSMHDEEAPAITDALRFVEEEQDTDTVMTGVTRSVLVEGYGGAVKEIERDADGEYRHRLTQVQWDRIGYDPSSRMVDFSDARYRFIVRWADVDDAIADYPEAEDTLRASVAKDIGSDDTTEDSPRRWSDKSRNRVKIIEMYVQQGPDCWRYDFTQVGDLREPAPTVYKDEKQRHSICPLIMVSCYIDRDGMRYGVVRGLVSLQDSINKRESKAIHALNVSGAIAEQNAIPDESAFLAERAKPDGLAIVGMDALRDGRLQLDENMQLSAGHVQMMQQAIQDIETIGPSSSTMPELPTSSSGRAFAMRQKAASQELGEVFDHIRAMKRQVYKTDWLCIRQFWAEEKWLRVTDDEQLTGYRFVALNRNMPRAQRFQEMLEKKPTPPTDKALSAAAGNDAPIVMADVEQQRQALLQQAQQQMQVLMQQAQQLQQAAQQDPSAAMMLQQAMPQVQQAQTQLQELQGDAILHKLIARHPLMQEVITANQVSQIDVDIRIDIAPDTAVIAQEEFSALSEVMPMVMQSRPDMAPAMVKLLLQASQLRNKREILRELEKGSGEQAEAQQQQAQQQAQQAQQAQMQAALELSKSQAALNAAKAQSEQAKAQTAMVEAQTAMPKTQSEIEKNQAAAMLDAAQAGDIAGG